MEVTELQNWKLKLISSKQALWTRRPTVNTSHPSFFNPRDQLVEISWRHMPTKCMQRPIERHPNLLAVKRRQQTLGSYLASGLSKRATRDPKSKPSTEPQLPSTIFVRDGLEVASGSPITLKLLEEDAVILLNKPILLKKLIKSFRTQYSNA